MGSTLSRLLLALAAATQLVACGDNTSSSGDGAAPPSIVLITIDTLRADHLPSYGHHRDTAPFLAELGDRGLVFERAYATSSWTVPSAATIATGLYPPSHGVVHGVARKGKVYEQRRLPTSLPTLAEQLQELGYRTYAMLGNAHMDADHGFARGFDRFHCPGFLWAEEIESELDGWIDDIRGGDGPFFLWLHYLDPHHPYHQHEPWFSAYQPDAQPDELERIEQAYSTWKPRIPPIMFQQSERYVTLLRSLYDSDIRWTDEHIRRVFERLALDDALVLVTADHGEEFLEHGGVGHGSNLFEETVRVPLILAGPGIEPGRRTEVANLVDVPVTILRAAGGEPPGAWPGLDLRSAIDPERITLAHLHRFPDQPVQAALIGPRHKFIVELKSGRSLLFDLATDPGEKNNVGATAPEVARAQAQQLDELLRSLPPPPDDDAVVISDERADELKALGYVD